MKRFANMADKEQILLATCKGKARPTLRQMSQLWQGILEH